MDEEPPPLPPKMRSAAGGRYTDQDIAKALEEENKEYERIKREKLGRSQSHRVQSTKENSTQGNYITVMFLLTTKLLQAIGSGVRGRVQ